MRKKKEDFKKSRIFRHGAGALKGYLQGTPACTKPTYIEKPTHKVLCKDR